MKKICKKTLGIFLSLAILLCSIPIPKVYALGGIEDYAEAMDSMEEIMDEMDVPSLNEQLEDFIIESEKYYGKTSEQLENITKSLNSVSSVMTAFQYVSYATSAVNNILSILKMIGIMEDSSQAKLDSILDAVKSLKNDVEEINKKVSNIQKELTNNFSEENYKLDQIKAQNLQNVWTDFMRNEYVQMMNIVTAYEERVNQLAISLVETWKKDNKTDLRSLYNSKGLLLYSGSNYNGFEESIPVTPEMSDDTYNSKLDTAISHEIILPSKYLEVTSKTIVNADNYEELIRNTILNGVKKAIKDGTIKIDNESLSFWNLEKATEDDIASKITEDLINSIFYEITSTIANSNIGNGTTFAQNALSTYQAFCGAIRGENNTDSALDKALEALTLTFAFEGEAKEYAIGYYTLIGMATMQFGTLTSTLVATTPSIKSSVKSSLGELIYETMKRNNETYKNFFHGHDNYCYPLKGVLTYVDISAQTLSQSYTDYKYEGCTGGRCEWSEKHDSFSDWVIVDSSINFNTDNIDVYKFEAKKNEAILKNSMVNTQNLAYLYHYIKAVGSNQNIMDYLKNNQVITTEGTHSTTLVTPNYAIKDQPLDSTTLQSYPFASDFKKIDKYNTDEVLAGYENEKFVKAIKKDNYKTPIHSKIVGDIFSLSGSPSSNLAKDEIESRTSSEVTLGTRIFQFYDGSFATPRYILHDEAKITVDVSESAADPAEFYLSTPYRSIYTAKVEKKYGALVLNYDKNTDTDKYQVTINNKNDFTTFIKNIANGNTYEGKKIILNNDIDMNNENLENYWPSSAYNKVFKGTFNGNNKTISNLTFKSSESRVGLFRTTGENAIIENLKLKNVNIGMTANKNGYAALVGYADGKLIVNNVEILSGTINGYKYVAGIVGEARENTKVHILNCKNNAFVTSQDTDAGGMIGNTGNYYIYNCVNTGNITANRGAAGGMSGYSGSDNKNDSSFVRNSKNSGTITGYDCAGGMSGHIASDNRFSRFIGNENTGNVTVTTKGSAGGIVGYTEAGGAYIDNKSSGTIESKNRYAGGILGENEDDPIIIKNNTNDSIVKSVEKAGGIAGYLGDKDYDSITIIEHNTNNGKIESTSTDKGDAGGIIGAVNTDNKRHAVNNNTNKGEVIAARQAGGIVGWMAGGGTFDSNSNKASITSTTQNAGAIVGKIEDDKCVFKNSKIYNPHIIVGENIGTAYVKYDYKIKINNTSMHAGKICGWDGNKKASINSDSLVATIFGSGNIFTIAIMSITLIIIAIFMVIINKPRKIVSKKNNKKTKKVDTSKK